MSIVDGNRTEQCTDEMQSTDNIPIIMCNFCTYLPSVVFLFRFLRSTERSQLKRELNHPLKSFDYKTESLKGAPLSNCARSHNTQWPNIDIEHTKSICFPSSARNMSSFSLSDTKYIIESTIKREAYVRVCIRIYSRMIIFRKISACIMNEWSQYLHAYIEIDVLAS